MYPDTAASDMMDGKKKAGAHKHTHHIKSVNKSYKNTSINKAIQINHIIINQALNNNFKSITWKSNQSTQTEQKISLRNLFYFIFKIHHKVLFLIPFITEMKEFPNIGGVKRNTVQCPVIHQNVYQIHVQYVYRYLSVLGIGICPNPKYLVWSESEYWFDKKKN